MVSTDFVSIEGLSLLAVGVADNGQAIPKRLKR